MFGSWRQTLAQTSWPIIAAMFALMGFGVVAIHVAEKFDPSLAGQMNKQLLFSVAGLAAFVGATMIPYPRLGKMSYLLFGVTLVLLVAVFFTTPVKGTTRWFNLGIIKLQPSELAKLTYIMMLAWYLRYGDHYRKLRGLITPFLLTLIPAVLILLEPDLGTTLLFLPTLYFMLFMAGARITHLLMIVALGLIVIFCPLPREDQAGLLDASRPGLTTSRRGPVTFYAMNESVDWSQRTRLPLAYAHMRWGDGTGYHIQPLSLWLMRGHQYDRIEGWLRQEDPEVARKEGFQLRWSLVTLATGSWMGGRQEGDAGELYRGMLPLALNQLPEHHTDFIFSVIGGQWGFWGCLWVLALYSVILVFGLEIASATHDPFGRLLAIGVLGLMLSQLFINVGMTMGLMPITGMTLPLVSYGGSSLVINCAALGLLVNVGQRNPMMLSRRPFEHGQKREKQTNMEYVRAGEQRRSARENNRNGRA